jgi:hypothetical protein
MVDSLDYFEIGAALLLVGLRRRPPRFLRGRML